MDGSVQTVVNKQQLVQAMQNAKQLADVRCKIRQWAIAESLVVYSFHLTEEFIVVTYQSLDEEYYSFKVAVTKEQALCFLQEYETHNGRW